MGERGPTAATLTSTDPVLAAFADEIGAEGAVAVVGGRSRWATGGASPAGTRLVRAPEGIVEYIPDEMIVRVRCGTTVAELAAALAERGQRTALPERSATATVGGAFAVGENHVAMLGRGALRASLLQVRYVSSDGRIVTGGGPTVKNVTGFDLPRLMVGALGTLGLLAEVIVRTNPIPAASAWFELADTDPFVVRNELLRPSTVLHDGDRTWVQLEGHRLDVDAELGVLRRLGSPIEIAGPPPLPAHRWSLPPGDLRRLDAFDTGPFVAGIGTGLVFADRPQPARSLPASVVALSQRMKQNFDPSGRLNPGRTPGGN